MLRKTLIRVLLISFFAGISCIAASQGSANSNKSSYRNKIDSLLEYLSANNKLMGSATIAKGGKVVYEKEVGYSEISAKKVPDALTKYRIGSITKMFTSVMIFQLIEEGKISIDVPLSRFFPGLSNSGKITIGNLLNHHSGLFNMTNDSTYSRWDTLPKTEDEILKIIKGYKPVFQPGEKGEYSNTNYILLGYIIEKLTGKTYSEELNNRIVNKIGLKNTYYGHKINANNDEAFSYSFLNEKWVKSKETDMSIPGGAGAVVSTPVDLTKFIYELFNGKLISQASFNQMTTMKDNFGMGIFPISFYDKKGFGHTGGINGFVSNLEYFPDDSVAIAFCSNGLNYNMNQVLIGILSSFYDKPYVLPSFKIINIPVNELTKYEGNYTSPILNLRITIKRDGKNLSARAANQSAFPISAVSETQFVFDAASITIDFTVPENGKVSEFYLKQNGGRFLFTRDK